MHIDVHALKYHAARKGITFADLAERVGRTYRAFIAALHRGGVRDADVFIMAHHLGIELDQLKPIEKLEAFRRFEEDIDRILSAIAPNEDRAREKAAALAEFRDAIGAVRTRVPHVEGATLDEELADRGRIIKGFLLERIRSKKIG